LSIIRKGFNSYLNGSVIWSNTNNNGDVWKYGSVSLPNNFSSNYVLIIEGKVGGSGKGDIALDDLKITNKKLCSSSGPSLCAFTCSNGACISEEKVCNFVKDCPNGEEETNCGYQNVTFETGYNNWKDLSTGSWKWTRKNNGDNLNNGPSVG
jgi:hypothetical protein